MVVSNSLNLPTEEELTVQEVNLSSSSLRAASFHLGKYCENINNEFMLCRSENPQDPRKCLEEGKAVTNCSLDFFRKMKKNCRQEFETYAECIDKSSTNFALTPCRKTQGVYDKCVLEKLNIERPYWGYFAQMKVHDTKRPRPQIEEQIYPDASDKLSDDAPRTDAKYQGRYIFQ
uniref:NADH dehydrogenase [ubiquinone] 1 alpha subcomplex subunit 8 n=1 Tax=Riptortus pedestris TaxID=329032 RepID=R4WT51_RIPPE|nr:NADH:ubiquinone dehydrogenase, putative [Riptortus pedestris]